MANMPDAIEVAVNDYLTRGVTPAALTGPIRVQLLSALGVGDAASTPITVATTAILALGAGATVSGTGANSNGTILRWEGLANPTTVAGFRTLDSTATTPIVTLDNIARTGGSVSVTGGIFEIPAGGLVSTSA